MFFAAAFVLAIVATTAGLLERRSERGGELAGIDRIVALVGPQLQRPTTYHVEVGMTCLDYGSGGRAYALEICVDATGRIIEAADRRGLQPLFYSILPNNELAKQHIDPALVPVLVKRVVAPGAARAKPRRDTG